MIILIEKIGYMISLLSLMIRYPRYIKKILLFLYG